MESALVDSYRSYRACADFQGRNITIKEFVGGEIMQESYFERFFIILHLYGIQVNRCSLGWVAGGSV